VKDKSVQAVFQQRPRKDANRNKPYQVATIPLRFGTGSDLKQDNRKQRKNPEGAKTI
jgi:hypothetical protein